MPLIFIPPKLHSWSGALSYCSFFFVYVTVPSMTGIDAGRGVVWQVYQ
jgi:hypothetical protein